MYEKQEWGAPRGHEAQSSGVQISIASTHEGQPRRKDRGDGVLGRAAVRQGLDGEHAHGAVDVLVGWDPVSILVQLWIAPRLTVFCVKIYLGN